MALARKLWLPAYLLFLAVAAYWGTLIAFGETGLWGEALPAWVAQHSWLAWGAYFCVIGHLTITAMSLCFHRVHTHQAARLHPVVDMAMQLWLWAVTSMSKRDWVSVHIYHHAHSDQPEDAHSPVQNGIWHALFLGVLDYSKAKSLPAVLKIRSRIPENKLESFMDQNLFLGPILLSFCLMVAVGPKLGLLLSVTNFLVSPILAVGGVNAIAHWWGYRNYKTTDNSRNIGFVFPLNFIICGELDHNNHHRHPKSASFAHRWFEWDVGYVYLRALEALGLATVLHVQQWKRAEAPRAVATSGVAASAALSSVNHGSNEVFTMQAALAQNAQNMGDHQQEQAVR